jgi:hypothetical protein
VVHTEIQPELQVHSDDRHWSRRELFALGAGALAAGIFSGQGQASAAPVPPGVLWAAAFRSRSQSALDAWYAAHTGYTALGLREAQLWNVGDLLDLTDSWLQAHAGNGHVVRTGKRWLVRAIKCRNIRFSANNVTVRGALIQHAAGGLYGASYRGTTASTFHGAILEYATMRGNRSPHFAHYFVTGSPRGLNTSVVRNCDISGYRSGGPLLEGTTLDYCHIHDLHLFDGAHNTSATVRGSDVMLRRNSLKDGTSSAVSVYADTPLDNVLIKQNVLNTPHAHWALNFPSSKKYAVRTTDTRFLNNLFGQQYFPGCGSSGPQTGLGLFTQAAGNRMMDGTPVS